MDINLIQFVKELNLQLLDSSTEQVEQYDVSELMMHKILYIQYGLFYSKFNKELFPHANFVAWKLGPVEIDYRKNKETYLNIQKFNICLNQEEVDYLKLITKKLLQTSAFFLVDFTHTTQAWLDAYEEGKSNSIFPDAIKETFKFTSI